MSAFWEALQSQRTLAAMMLLFALLALSHLWSVSHSVDTWTFLPLNTRGTRPPWLDWLMLGLTQMGSTVAAIAVALTLFLADRRVAAYEMVLGSLTLWIVVELIKALVRRARPFIGLTQARVVGYRARGLSFPSGHTSQAFFMATLMIQHLQAGLGLAILLYGLALAVGITRVYVGAHYPRDVLAGILLGSAWGLLVRVF